jgi:hypothetical protein
MKEWVLQKEMTSEKTPTSVVPNDVQHLQTEKVGIPQQG